MSWDVYVYVFFLAHVKFLFAASIAEATTSLNFLEILISSTLNSINCLAVFKNNKNILKTPTLIRLLG